MKVSITVLPSLLLKIGMVELIDVRPHLKEFILAQLTFGHMSY